MTISGLGRHDEAVKLKKAGVSYAETGRGWGITRERVRQIATGNPKRDTPSLDSKPVLTISEAALLLGVHTNTVRRWSNQGILRAYRISDRGDRRFRREDIDRFLRGIRGGEQ